MNRLIKILLEDKSFTYTFASLLFALYATFSLIFYSQSFSLQLDSALFRSSIHLFINPTSIVFPLPCGGGGVPLPPACNTCSVEGRPVAAPRAVGRSSSLSRLHQGAGTFTNWGH